jgi:hypothetical protein
MGFDGRDAMRWLPGIVLLCLVVGCAAKPRAEKPARPPAAASEAQLEQVVVASALVFDPPIAINEQPLDLARDPRQAAAVVGFDQLTTTFFYLQTDDKQRFDNFNTGGAFERRAVSQRFGVSFR